MQTQDQKVIDYDESKIVLLSKDENGVLQIIKLKKNQFPLQYEYQFQNLKKFNQYHQNDIFNKYELVVDDDQINQIDCELIKPVNQSQHIVIEETKEMYEQFVKPYIEMKTQQNNLQWLYNILEKKAEQENILHENAQFMIIRNYTFIDEKNLEQLHLLGLPFDRKLQSLRDLNKDHIQLLKEIQLQGKEYISKRYNIPPNQVVTFIHYQPSFYHLHIHFKHINDHDNDTLRDNHLINNQYYQNITLQYKLKQSQYEMIFQQQQQI